MTTFPPTQAARQESRPDSTFPLITSAEPSSWMPLEGLAQTWASFAGTFLSQPAFMATSLAFAALSLEAHALRQESTMCFRRCNGDVVGARAAGTRTVEDLQAVQAQWQRVLYWLEQLSGDKREPRSREEQAHIRALFFETITQLQRLNTLIFQVQEGCVVYYQRTGVYVEQDERASRHAATEATAEGEEE
jgi:hypothetical protein